MITFNMNTLLFFRAEINHLRESWLMEFDINSRVDNVFFYKWLIELYLEHRQHRCELLGRLIHAINLNFFLAFGHEKFALFNIIRNRYCNTVSESVFSVLRWLMKSVRPSKSVESALFADLVNILLIFTADMLVRDCMIRPMINSVSLLFCIIRKRFGWDFYSN